MRRGQWILAYCVIKRREHHSRITGSWAARQAQIEKRACQVADA